MTSIAFLIVRLVVGLAIASHGSQKLFGWFGGSGPRGTAEWFAKLRFPLPLVFAVFAGIGEFAGGLLLAAGWLGAVGPAMIVSVMLVAAMTEHLSHGFYNYNNGYELPVLYAMAALAVAFAGPGTYSLDSVISFGILAGAHAASIAIAIGLMLSFATLECRLPAESRRTRGAH